MALLSVFYPSEFPLVVGGDANVLGKEVVIEAVYPGHCECVDEVTGLRLVTTLGLVNVTG